MWIVLLPVVTKVILTRAAARAVAVLFGGAVVVNGGYPQDALGATRVAVVAGWGHAVPRC
jgi:hypothetical protein